MTHNIGNIRKTQVHRDGDKERRIKLGREKHEIVRTGMEMRRREIEIRKRQEMRNRIKNSKTNHRS
jgi:hypothetical protein